MGNLPFKVGDWVRHKILGKVKVDTIEPYRVKIIDQHGSEFYLGRDRVQRMIVPINAQHRDQIEEIACPQDAQASDPAPIAPDFPFRLHEWIMQSDGELICFVDLTPTEVVYTNTSGQHFRVSHHEALRLIFPEHTGRKTPPEAPAAGRNRKFMKALFGTLGRKSPPAAPSEELLPLSPALPDDMHAEDESRDLPSRSLVLETGEWSARSYQSEALRALTEAFHTHDRIVLALPTGSGKTYVAAKWICDHVLRQGKKVIWIAHRTELLDQAYVTFVKLLPPDRVKDITWWVGGRSKNQYGALVFVSIMAARDFPSMHADLVVIDEAHHEPAQSYRRLQRTITCAKHLGLTATPKRLDERPLGYDVIAYQKTFMALVAAGWLARPKPVIPQTRLTFALDVRMDDFSEESLAALDTEARNTLIAEHWAQWRHHYGKTLLFAINKAHARRLYEHFVALSPPPRVSYIVSGEGTRADREREIQKFRRGDLDVLINCKIFTEGFDCPDVGTICITRPTLSATLYMQMVGRGTRVTSTKKSFYLVDFEDNLGKFQQQLIGPWYLEETPRKTQKKPVDEHEQATPEAIDLHYFPEWLQQEVALKPVDLSLLAGYVIYHLESGREDGFLIHVNDEEAFLEIWSELKTLAHHETPIEHTVQTALRLGQQATFQRVSLQGLLSASIALTSQAARYVSLKQPNVPEKVLAFLEGTTFDLDELTEQIHDLYAVLKFTDDELSDEIRCEKVFERDAGAFHEATMRLEQVKNVRGFQLRQSIEDIYQSCLMDTSLDAYAWERFAVRKLKHPDDCMLLLSECGV